MLDRNIALKRFRDARKQAGRDQLTAILTGRDNRVIPFDAIRHELAQKNPSYRGVQNIPLAAVVGSVGRYQEFTRRFLPLNDSLAERWIGVDSLARAKGWPPIEVYQVGNIYFVKDGNHRVSVAQQLALDTIEARVWEFPGGAMIGPEHNLDDMLIELGHANFMQKTGLADIHPDQAIRFTTPGQYTELLAQIEDLRQKLSLIDEEEMPYSEAVAAWYEMLYMPAVQIIEASTLLDDFPGRTKSDLFVWLSQNREALREQYGDYENLADLAEILAKHYKEGSLQKAARQVRRLLGQDKLPPLMDIDGGNDIG